MPKTTAAMKNTNDDTTPAHDADNRPVLHPKVWQLWHAIETANELLGLGTETGANKAHAILTDMLARRGEVAR